MEFHPAMLLLPFLLTAAPGPAAAQPVAGGGSVVAPALLDAKARQEIVAKLGEALRGRYVFPDVGMRAAARIDAALAAGDYEGLADRAAFAARLSADVDAIAHDKHFVIFPSGALLPPPPGAQARRPPAEGGIVRADRLAGGIGYIEVIGFPPPGPFRQVLDRAMSGLAGSRAMIVDVRRNMGGVPDAVSYLSSYFVAPDQPLNAIVARIENTSNFKRQDARSVATPVSFAGVPVYVLTSKDTVSGGEAFAYDMQALGRGIVIGEVSQGAANPSGPVNLAQGFAAAIPFGRAENPVTKTNWEGRGVQPDVAVPAAAALATALKRAGQKPVAEVADASIQQVFAPQPRPMMVAGPGSAAPRTTPLPGSEPALRAVVAGYASGKPDYAAMAPDVADMVRQQLTDLQAQFAALGPLRAMNFRGPDMLGGDEYALHFANGDRMMALVLGPAGTILALSMPIPLPPGQ